MKERLRKIPFVVKAYRVFTRFLKRVATVISPTLNTKLIYYHVFKKKLDLKNPVTLNEKVLYLKLYRYIKNPLVIKCADKYRVREYVKECGCGEFLNELLGVWERPEEIPWDNLPQKFALKWNFGAGMNIICDNKDALDKQKATEQMKKWGKCKCWLDYSEMQYKYAPRKIICEKYLNDGNGLLPLDYKVMCFNGRAEYVMLCVGREKGEMKYYWFDREWRLQRINRSGREAPEGFTVKKPKCIDEIFECAEKLAKPFPFVRADFYAIEDKAYFGELTFTPAGGIDGARLPETDIMLGNKVNLHYKGQKES